MNPSLASPLEGQLVPVRAWAPALVLRYPLPLLASSLKPTTSPASWNEVKEVKEGLIL